MADDREILQISRFLSLILRHRPETIGIKLDPYGWAHTQELIDKSNKSGRKLDLALLQQVVEKNDKKRFTFSADESHIRANQGHSIPVDLQLKPQSPPDVLYHGTAHGNLDAIMKKGLQKGTRHHVHLSTDRLTAERVGSRHGKPVILTVLAGEMSQQGMKFYCSVNGIWLTDMVPPHFIDL